MSARLEEISKKLSKEWRRVCEAVTYMIPTNQMNRSELHQVKSRMSEECPGFEVKHQSDAQNTDIRNVGFKPPENITDVHFNNAGLAFLKIIGEMGFDTRHNRVMVYEDGKAPCKRRILNFTRSRDISL